MSDVKWTKEQLQVIDSRNSNLLVSAAAGSGKTAVLIERIIKLILDEKNPIDINKLLVVTFTKAAATEMRERVGKAIEKALENDVNNEHLQKQFLLLSGADITTIDSFCKNVLTSNAHIVDYDSNIKVIDPGENEILASEIIDELFLELYEKRDEKFLKLVDWYASKSNDDNLKDVVLTVSNFVNSYPFPNEWLDEMAEFYNVKEKDEKFYLEKYILDIVEDANIKFEFLIQSIQRELDEVENYVELEKYADIFQDLMENFEPLNDKIKVFLSKKSLESFNTLLLATNEFLNLKFGSFKIPAKTDESVKLFYNSIKPRLDSYKKEIYAELSKFNIEIDDIKAESKMIYPYMRALSDVVILFRKCFLDKKRNMNMVDFADIEHFALEILTDRDENGNIISSKVANEYIEKYEEVFIDEYQDSNMVQELILSRVSRITPPNRFMVGDVKQSIYRFRQADPSIFMKKYEEYSNFDDDKNSFYKKIMLYANFRSRKEVLEGTNYIFSKIMRKETGELDYTDDERLNPRAVFKELDDENGYVGGAVEINLVDENTENSEEDFEENEFEDVKSFRLECIKIANIIYKMINNPKNFKVLDKKTDEYKNVTYKDIVILMRSPSRNAKILEEVLNEYSIPLYAESTGGYFDAFEVDTIINLLKVIDNPISDIPLVAVMRSPIYNFNPRELSKIRLIDNSLSFYDLLMKILEDDVFEDENLKEKIKKFITDLKIFSEKKVLMSTDELIWYLFKYTGYYNYVGLLEMGEQRKSNLMLLFEKARQYEKNSYKGLFNFINYIEKIKLKGQDTSEAKLISEDANVVKLMSIHKSKGLEFPVVILANTDKKFNFRADDSRLTLHQKLGYGATVYDMDKKMSFKSIMKEKIENVKKKEQIAEEMRLLYVAMTRAKEKLIITGRVKDFSKLKDELEKVKGKPNNFEILSSNNYLNWIMMSISDLENFGEIFTATGEKRRFLGNDALKFQLEVKDKFSEIIEYERIKEEIFSNNVLNNLGLNFEEKKEIVEVDSLKDFLKDRFDKAYEYKDSLAKPSSISVSEIKKMIEVDENLHEEYYNKNFNIELKTPEFIHSGENKVAFNSAEKGTIFHLVMQLLDFSKFNLENFSNVRTEIKKQLTSFVERNILSVEEMETVNIYWIIKFIESDIFKQIYRANLDNKLFKEKAINYNMKLSEVYKNSKTGDEKIMVVGIIDLFFENENGEIVLVDYKTDFVTEENLESIKEKYKIQLNLYKDAIERNSAKKVVKKGLYLFGINRFVEV